MKKIVNLEKFPFDPAELKVNKTLLKKHFPEIYDQYVLEKSKDIDELDYRIIDELLDYETLNKNIDKIYFSQTVVSIKISDGTEQHITNTAIITFNGTEYEDHSVFNVDERFVIIFIVGVNLQSGSIGIWDINLNNWCFTHMSNSNFTSFNYEKSKDEFTFVEQFYHSHPDHGVEENTFKVDKSRNIVEKKIL